MAEVLQGKGVVPGVAVGIVRRLQDDLQEYLDQYQAGDKEQEQQRLGAAIATAVARIERSVKDLREKGHKQQAAIMEAHLFMANDPTLEEAMVGLLEEGMAAPQAVLAASEQYAAMFAAMEDAYLRERAADIRDVGRRIAKILLGVAELEVGDEPVILCAMELEPSVLANLPGDKVKGVILGQGSTTSHAVIIAKARGLITVVGVADALEQIADAALVVLDGHQGTVIVGPDPAVKAEYEAKAAAEAEQRRRDLANAGLPAVTKDGVRVQLAANIGIPQDIDNALPFGSEGVGLFRTEFLFMGREALPDEEEQFEAYKYAAERCGEHTCVIRTMDIGGDKPLPYLEIGKEENPFLGWRAIRISLRRPDLFIPQLKAILRAGVYGKVAIMLPMVINVAEIRQAKEFVKQAIAELTAEGKAFSPDVPLGIMVETPAAAVMTPMLAAECDFFSIGTNDLVQYTLAVDRGNQNISNLYNHFHPAVLRLIQTTIGAAREQGIWSGMCGEMAGDPAAAILLMAMGIHELSMSGPAIPRVKEALRQISLPEAKAMLEQALTLDDGDAVRSYLQSELKRILA